MTERPTGATEGAKETRSARDPAARPGGRGHRDQDRLLLRLLTDPRGERGDLSPAEARELRRRLEEEPELASRFERLAAPWRVLEPPPDTLPPGFGGRVMARVREEGRRAPSLLAAPVAVRSLATLALLVGLAAGPLLVGRLSDVGPDLAPVEIAETLEADWLEDSPSLAESYLQVLAAETGGPAAADPREPDGGDANGDTNGSTNGSADSGGVL